jgi:hypothetical protein
MDPGEATYGILRQEVAQGWVDEVRPLAVALLRDGDQREARSVAIRARGRDPVEAPHGPLMLTWPVRDGREAVINHLVDCRTFLRVYERLLIELPQAEGHLRAVLTDGSRLRIAVTNDVLQVLAPGPGGAYSMIRHHALMFFAAHLWLPEAQQPLWADLYRASVGPAGQWYRASDALGSPRRYLDDLECRAFAALDELAVQAATLPPGGDPIGAEDPRLRLVLNYLHAANAAVAVLLGDYQATRPEDRTRWLRQQLAVDYRTDGFLVDRWHAVLSLPPDPSTRAPGRVVRPHPAAGAAIDPMAPTEGGAS